jgi:hypothetical protein
VSLAEQPPAWALDALGPVPEDVVERQEWEHRAGWAAAWRELAGHTDEHDPLGAAPPRGQVRHCSAPPTKPCGCWTLGTRRQA